MFKATDSLQYHKPLKGKSNINNNGDGSLTEIIENQALQTISQSINGALNEMMVVVRNIEMEDCSNE